MNTNRPNPLRCSVTVLLSLTCAALLIEIDSTTAWPSADPSAFLIWWERLGTDAAAITLLRIVGITIAGWGIFIGTAGLLAWIWPSGLLHGVWRRITPGSFRKILAASAITIALASPAVAATTNQSVKAQIVLEDLGPAEELNRHVEPARFTPVLTDLGLARVQGSDAPEPAPTTLSDPDTTAPRRAGATSAAPVAEPRPHAQRQPEAGSQALLWTVEEGDHLWKIAMKILRDHDHPTDPAAVVGYWQQIIDLNSEALSGDPDLIHPGMVLNLPELPPRP